MLSLALHLITNHATFQDVSDVVNVTLPSLCRAVGRSENPGVPVVIRWA